MERRITIFPGTHTGGGDIPRDLLQSIKTLVDDYTSAFHEKVLENGLNRQVFSIFKPANLLLIVDREKIVLIKSHKNAGIGMPLFVNKDFRGETPGQVRTYLFIANRDLGFEDMSYIVLPIELLSMDESRRKAAVTKSAHEHFELEFKELIRIHQPPILTRLEIESFLDKANEEDFINLLLVPLFRKMGFEKVVPKGHEDRTMEFGQDIKLMKFRLPTDHYLYFVSQIEVGNIVASSKQPTQEIEALLTQVRPAFNKSIFDPDIGRNVTPDHVLLITSGQMSGQAKQYIYEQIDKSQRRQILLLERDQIVDLYLRYGLPAKNQETIKQYGGKTEAA